MKVIGYSQDPSTSYGGKQSYIAIVTHDEICAVMDKSSYSSKEAIPRLKVGEDFNLAMGHSFRREITEAIRQMTTAYEKFSKVAPIAAEFAGIVAAKDAAATTNTPQGITP